MQLPIVPRSVLSLLACLLFAACSGSISDSNAGTGGSTNAGSSGTGGENGGGGAAGGSATTGGATVSNGGEGAITCGATTCGTAQYCVMPCCGGAALACFSVGDAGTCPSGSHSGCSGPSINQCAAGTNCCQYNPCTPPPPYCSDTRPVGCFATGRTCQMMCA